MDDPVRHTYATKNTFSKTSHLFIVMINTIVVIIISVYV